jgi:hypothetical protein
MKKNGTRWDEVWEDMGTMLPGKGENGIFRAG